MNDKKLNIRFSAVLMVALSLWLILESGLGIGQVLGLAKSHHALFPLTGHFNNHGPYGGFIATLVAICFSECFLSKREDNKFRLLIGVATVLGFLVLPASMSRAAWLGLLVAGVLSAVCQEVVQVWMQTHLWCLPVLLLVFLTVCAGMFFLKRESALGRLHIWHMECRIIADHPWTGVGHGNFAYAYGQAQADFFREAERSELAVRLAGCPEYAFNEYLGAGVEFGIAGLLLAVVLAVVCCVVLTKRNHPLGCGCVVFSVFAFFSYPLSLWQFQLLGGIFIAASLEALIKRRGHLSFLVLAVVVAFVFIYRKNTPEKENARQLFAQGHTLFLDGASEAALPILEQGARMSSDPMFHNIMGRCQEALGRYGEAEAEYWQAHYMVPSRLYPLVLLQELYLAQGDTVRADAVYAKIGRMPVNQHMNTMKELSRRADGNWRKTQGKDIENY